MAATASTNEIRAGMKVEVDGQAWTIVSNEFFKPGKGASINRIKMKHLVNGRVVERTYKSGDKLDLADVEDTHMRMLYKESDGIVFMDDNSFEQIKISNEKIADALQWIMEEVVYDVIFYKGEPVAVEPPTFMDMVIIETNPGDRGNTASGRVMKPAIVQSGASIQVPIFINQGEKIRIDTRTGDYVSRVNE
jgi:elongation factor P